LKKLDSKLIKEIQHQKRLLKKGEAYEDKYFRIYKVSQESLDPSNLFKPIAVSDVRILKFWEEISHSNRLERAHELGIDLEEGTRSRQGGKFPETALLDKGAIGLTSRDLWIAQKVTEDKVKVKNRITKDSLEIPLEALVPCARNSAGRDKMDLSGLCEFVVSGKFDDHTHFASISGIDANALSTKWKEYLQRRMSNLGIIETLHVDASGTFFFAYYTEKPRVFGSSFWNVVGLDATEAKILAIWLNSTINLAQLFIERVPTGWFKVRGYTFNSLLLLSKNKLNPNDSEALINLFDSVSKVQFPCLWKQLAMNVDPQTLTDEWKGMLGEIFTGLKKYLGSGFQTRREIDRVILKILGYSRKEIDDILEWLYPALLREVYILKKLNRVDTSSS